MHATERRPFEEIIRELPATRAAASNVIARMRKVRDLEAGAQVLDVGAAHGAFVAACAELGFQCRGVEPCASARENARLLADHLRMPIDVRPGTAESLPFPDSTFHLIHAASVIEHVGSAQKAFAEAFRVLKPGGVFYFRTASSICPVQDEIRGFPFFGWYPDPIKLKIMAWAKDSRPALVGHTDAPAIHWFTPWKARRMLQAEGFKTIHDRWDLRGDNEGGAAYRAALKLIRSGPLTKLAADVIVPQCAFAATK